MTSVILDCLGCGLPADAPSLLCSRCAELVEFERYFQPEPMASERLTAQRLRAKLADLLPKVMFPGMALVATLAGILLISAVLCQLSGLDCSLYDHCLHI